MPSSSKKQHNFMAAIANSPAFAKKVGIPQSVGSDFERADKGRKFAKGGETMATKDKMDKSQDKSMIKRAFKQHDAQEHKGGKGTELKLKHGGMTKMAMGGDVGGDELPAMTTTSRPAPMPRPAPKIMGGSADKMMRPGPTTPTPVARPMPRIPVTDNVPTPPPARARQIMNKIAANRPFKSGGSVGSASTRADGIAQKGKTKAMQVKMASGGYTVAPNGIAKMASGGMANSASRRADGIAQKGKTKAMQIKMMNGGKC